ncbi:MAG: carbohydrate ABC transporter substrate-binding protein [Ruminococcus sp.]|nr:carbohydrate ABC transporter substrate-binding protein [Ruminococcus sp.]
MKITLKKSVAMIASLFVSAALFSACAKKDNNAEAAAGPTSGGKVLNIYCWNDEFRSRVESYYLPEHPLPEGVTINWIVTPNADMAYQTKLDQTLPGNASASADDRVDIFLVEADYAAKYINTKYALSLTEVGITNEELADQYAYTKQIGSDSSGVIKGISWQAAPNVFLYRRSIANKVLGTDDPTDIQLAVADWDMFEGTAAKMHEQGYQMVSGYDDTFRAYSNNADKAIVENGIIEVPQAWLDWADQTKLFSDSGYNSRTRLWDTAWGAGMGKDSTVFGYFGPAWFINFTLVDYSMADAEMGVVNGNGSIGDWAVTEGPAPSYWGGTWICAAEATDNIDEIRDIMRVLCTDKSVMRRIATDPGVEDYTNTVSGMKEVAQSDYKSVTLGEQNPFPLYTAVADRIDVSKTISPYNQLAETYQGVMADYFSGAVTRETAIENFYTAAREKYPELKRNS